MPPHWRPSPRSGKQPPVVLLPGMEALVDLGDGTVWPKMLAIPNDAGLWYACYISWGFDTANEPNFSPPRFD
jgi:hypothetical protein